MKTLEKFDQGITLATYAYNEESLIAEFLDKALALMNEAANDYEIVVLDDGSSDKTFSIAKSYSEKYPQIRVFQNEKNLNVWNCFMKTMQLSSKKYIFWQMTDWCYDISKLKNHLQYLKEYDIICGARRRPTNVKIKLFKPIVLLIRLFGIKHLTRRSDTPWKAIVSVCNYFLIRFLFKIPLSDFQNICIFQTEWIKSINYESRSSFTGPEAIIKSYWRGKKIKEVEINFIARASGEAKGTKPAVIVKAVMDIFKLWFKWTFIDKLTISKLFNCPHCNSNLVESDINTKNLRCVKCENIVEFNQNPDNDKIGFYDFLIKSRFVEDNQSENSEKHWKLLGQIEHENNQSFELDYYHNISKQNLNNTIFINIACGTCRNLETYLKDEPSYLILIDISSNALKIAAEKVNRLLKTYSKTKVFLLRADVHTFHKIFKKPKTHKVVLGTFGFFNIIKEQSLFLKNILPVTDEVFLTVNSPTGVIGKLFYSLNPVRNLLQSFPVNWQTVWIRGFIKSCAYIVYPLIYIFVSIFKPEIKKEISPTILFFIFYDWVINTPSHTSLLSSSDFEKNGFPDFNLKIFNINLSQVIWYQSVKIEKA